MLATVIFATIVLLIVGLNRTLGFDASVGETKPKPTDKATYPKAYVHFVTAMASFWTMVLCGVNFWAAIAIMLVAIPLYEWSQKFINKWDMFFGALGVLTAALIYAY